MNNLEVIPNPSFSNANGFSKDRDQINFIK